MEALCASLRASYGATDFPVDVWKIARGLGILVEEARWTGLPHAISLYPVRVVILNRARNESARRFDLAHEIFHFVLGVERFHSARENRLAAELLMPARVVRMEVLGNGGPDARLAAYFGIAEAVLKLRAKELGWRG